MSIHPVPMRFKDENLRLSDFDREVWIVCPACEKKAVAAVDQDRCTARLLCTFCGCQRETVTKIGYAKVSLPAHSWFGADLWLQAPFRDEVFFALNGKHLDYLERYIAADLREHKDRSHFTLLEKLPRFYHEAKNRDALLKLIKKLKIKQ